MHLAFQQILLVALFLQGYTATSVYTSLPLLEAHRQHGFWKLRSSMRSFKCTCVCKFTQENTYMKHQQSCAEGKKWLLSALSKAKDLLGSTKQAWPDANGGRQDACVCMESSSMQLHHLQLLSLPSDHTNEAPSAQSSNVYLALSAGYPTLEVLYAGSSLQGNMPISTSTPNLSAVPAEIDNNSSLAQCRARRVDVQMPLRYQQYEDVLPQPPPSISSQAAPLQEFILPLNPTNMPTTTCTPLQSTPFHTARNVFVLVCQFFSMSHLMIWKRLQHFKISVLSLLLLYQIWVTLLSLTTHFTHTLTNRLLNTDIGTGTARCKSRTWASKIARYCWMSRLWSWWYSAHTLGQNKLAVRCECWWWGGRQMGGWGCRLA